MNASDIQERGRIVADVLARLFDDDQALTASVVADGWTEPMARAGIACHRRTWKPERLLEAVEREIGALLSNDRFELRPREPIVHIWPRLPGAGLTPVLFGALLGAKQSIRPSSRAGSFARCVADTWNDSALPPLNLLAAGEDWSYGDAIVVSGSDDTVDAVEQQLIDDGQRRGTVVTGYGHRISFGVVPSAARSDIDRWAPKFARDAVLWHQQGCFSLQSLLVEGDVDDARAVAAAVGGAIDAVESELDAQMRDEGVLARRAQAMSVADIEGRRYGDGFGWAEVLEAPFSGTSPAPHVVTCHPLSSVDALADAVALPSHQLQGAALPVGPRSDDWIDALADLGVTRVCPPGDLQSPPADWFHDGRSNLLDWLRLTTVD